MTNELLYKLKDVGFPQEVRGGVMCGEHADYVYNPTLEELIEECGRNFNHLAYVGIGEFKWEVDGYLNLDTLEHSLHYGRTPKEAVANLYLALKKELSTEKDTQYE